MAMNKNVEAENMRTLKAKGMSEKAAIMVNMKREKKPKEDKSTIGPCCDGPSSDYPYGLEISLENESLDRLGLKTLPEPGKSVTLTTKATVTRLSQSADSEKKSRSLSLQITDMAMSDAESADEE